jgi:dimeric dUTPase (all-alpha-NTP-PPase superfamily)
MLIHLKSLFEMQGGLDDHIKREQGLKGVRLFDEKILALIVELGECANEWRVFKFWSNDQEPRRIREVFCVNCQGTGTPAGIPEEAGVDCWQCEGLGSYFEYPLLEEYVDKLHFILSLGIHLKVDTEIIREVNIDSWKAGTITEQFLAITGKAYQIFKYADKSIWEMLIRLFVALGYMLGFTWDQVEAAYLDKNKVNHERQVEGY